MYVWKKIISKFSWHCISVWSLGTNYLVHDRLDMTFCVLDRTLVSNEHTYLNMMSLWSLKFVEPLPSSYRQWPYTKLKTR